eukprot:353208-Chlamydomonas_euryale.AAC.1
MSSDEDSGLEGSRKRKQTDTGFCQTVCGARCTTASNAKEFLRRRSKGAAWYWKHFNVVQGEDLKTKLQCKQCNDELNPANPSNLVISHFDGNQRCNKRRRNDEKIGALISNNSGTAVDLTGADTSQASGSGSVATTMLRRPMQQPIQKFASTAAQQDSAGKSLARFFYKNNIALHLVEDPDLQKAFGHLGVLLPDRRELGGSMLDTEFDTVKTMQSRKLASQSGYAITTDGFKKKYIEGGAPLLNVIALFPDGGSTFVKVVKAEGVTKDGKWFAQLHADIIGQLEPDDPSRIIGLVTDSASANSNGMKLLEKNFPHLILIPCSAHALNLLIKDVAGQGSTVKCKWTTQVFKDVLHLALVWGDSEKIRALVRQNMLAKYQQVDGIRQHCPTTLQTAVLSWPTSWRVLRDVARRHRRDLPGT